MTSKDARWMDDAACRDMDLRLFFPETPGCNRTTIEAKLICLTCPVKQQCLDFALKNNEHGIWGGKTEEQRKRLRREHRIPLVKAPVVSGCGTDAGHRSHIRRGEIPCPDCRRAAARRRKELREKTRK